MDIDMPVLNGIEATRQILRRQADVAVVGLSMHRDGTVAQAMSNAGAAAYVGKDSRPEALMAVIRRLRRP
jgi:DNA-binding NarL/FixJ family response regulator